LSKIDIVTAECNGFRDPETVPVHHEDQEVIADAVTTTFCRHEQSVDLGFSKKITPSFVGIRRLMGRTLYISPFGHALDLSRNSLTWRRWVEPTVYKMRVL
jgi:hypothetical protein